jgi:predicted transcriptional regulator
MNVDLHGTNVVIKRREKSSHDAHNIRKKLHKLQTQCREINNGKEKKKQRLLMKGKQTLERMNSNVRSNYEPQRLIHDVNKFINILKDNHSN